MGAFPPRRFLSRRPRRWDRRPEAGRRRLLLIGGAVAVVGVTALALWWMRSVSVRVDDLKDGASLGRKAVDGREVRVHVSGGGAAKLTVNGQHIGDAAHDGSALLWHLPNLADGTYRMELIGSRPLFGTYKKSLTFTVDSQAPTMRVPAIAPAPAIDQPFTVDGTLNEPAKVTADGATVDMSDQSFHLHFPYPPAAPVIVTATDAAGNSVSATVVVPVARPVTNGVHVTAVAWGNDQLRNEVLGLIANHQINTVELDLKDESGVVGYDSAVPLAHDIGAVQPSYSIKSTVADLHAKGVRVVGRIVAFRDPVLAKVMWDRGNHDLVVQNTAGQPLDAYGGFANFSNPDVQAYNLAIAEEAAKAGMDEILWDYVRRPENDISTMVFPGIPNTSEAVADAISGFLAKGQAMLRPLKTLQGASVFGIAATRPDQIGQDVPSIAMHTDYIAPLLYPSHWNNGEYGVANPNRQPYDIVKASLADFVAAVAPTGRPLAPWLQDFSQGVTYGDAQVQDQIRAAKELGVTSWFLWNAGTVYTTTALPAISG